MTDLSFDIGFPVPAARLEIALGVRDEPVALREYALVLSLIHI